MFFRVFFSTKSISELIKFCLDINCNINDEGILPRSLCQACLEKLQIAFELKNKSKESDKYLKEILQNSTGAEEPEENEMIPYNPSAYYPPDDPDGLMEESPMMRQMDEEDDGDSNGSDFNPPKGERSSNYECPFCQKEFKYTKSYKRHVKQHKAGSVTSGGTRRRYQLKMKKIPIPVVRRPLQKLAPAPVLSKSGPAIYKAAPAMQPQAPYDSQSPYGSPAPYASPTRDSSPDFGSMVTASFLHTNDNGASAESSSKRMRMRKQKLPSRSPSQEPSPEITVVPTKPRGRPSNKSKLLEVLTDEEKLPIAEFSEVDVSSMLKSKKNFSIMNEDSTTQSAPSTSRSRSRSVSVELIQEFDIFGSVLPDDGREAMKRQSGFGSGSTHQCSIPKCDKKFHLKANLKKHMREAHGKTWTANLQ